MTKDLDWLVKTYGDFFGKFGVDKETLLSHYDAWKVQSGQTAVTDYLWHLFHVLIGETKKQVSDPVDLHRNLHEIYLLMLEFRVNVEGQKDNALVQLIIKNRIRQWQAELPYPFHLQAVSINCCPHCERINGQIFEPEAVLHNTHLATQECTKETGCSCGYIPVAAASLQ
ncbi:hypothetical protein HRH25_10500 [Flavisolibacter sp. BT320]|nr:hypothetical protein [Flavisolibacter longurius]